MAWFVVTVCETRLVRYIVDADDEDDARSKVEKNDDRDNDFASKGVDGERTVVEVCKCAD